MKQLVGPWNPQKQIFWLQFCNTLCSRMILSTGITFVIPVLLEILLQDPPTSKDLAATVPSKDLIGTLLPSRKITLPTGIEPLKHMDSQKEKPKSHLGKQNLQQPYIIVYKELT